jgi:hypothetical protein
LDLDAPDSPPAAPPAPSISDFAPFPSLKDFEFAERMVQTLAPKDDINWNLKNGFPDLQFKNANQVHKLVDEIAAIYPKVCRLT